MIFSSFLIGFVVSYIGSITPSMLNITAVKISVEKNRASAKKYMWGVSLVVIFQSFFALYFLKTLLKTPSILNYIEKGAVVVFTFLSFYFFKKAVQEQTQQEITITKKNDFFTGIFLSVINLFSIPFYVVVGAYFNAYHWISLDVASITWFAIGAFFGTLLILFHYALFAEKIKKTSIQFSSYFNYILGAIAGFIALISLVKML